MKLVRQGRSIAECSAIHGVPTHTIYRWIVQDEGYSKAFGSRIYKYAKSVSLTEGKVTASISDLACIDISEEEWYALCQYVSNELYKLVQVVIEREERYWKERGQMNEYERG